MISLRAFVLLLASAAAPLIVQAQCKIIAPDAQDGPIAAPKNHTILYEDADVRVLDIHSDPHTRDDWHTHARPAVMYVDSQGAGKYLQPGQPNSKVRAKDDPTFKFRVFATEPEGVHATENTGNVPFHAIRVEFKHPGCSLGPNAPAAEATVDDRPFEGYSTIFENDDVRVADITVPARTMWRMKAHAWSGFVYLPRTNAVTVLAEGAKAVDGGLTIVPIARNQPYACDNPRDVAAHFIRFELKHTTPKAIAK